MLCVWVHSKGILQYSSCCSIHLIKFYPANKTTNLNETVSHFSINSRQAKSCFNEGSDISSSLTPFSRL